VIGGNERVVRPRLADAKFFFDQDRKKTLESRVAGLDKVVYHNKLGSQGERSLRVKTIAEWVAERVGAEIDLAGRAAVLAKADLLTDMVGEFPELQGVMGGYYARYDGENDLVAQAIEDQYLLHNDHTDATNLVSVSLDIADRVETLVGIWGIGLKPTGEKDPYALRRHSLKLISRFEVLSLAAFLGKDEMQLHLLDLLEFAYEQFPAELLSKSTISELREFIYDRFQNRLVGLGTHRVEVVDAVVSIRPPLHDTVARIQAVNSFAKLPEAPALAAANKRISNILKKEENVDATVNAVLLKEPAEIALFAAMNDVAPKAKAQFEAGDYTASLQILAALRAPVDAFFDGVMVNAEDLALRKNRQGLLKTLHEAMNRVADLSKLAT
jgi:glycyl-tRNA synthetase beta chain